MSGSSFPVYWLTVIVWLATLSIAEADRFQLSIAIERMMEATV
jgi:hypothetical protein